MLQMSDVTFSIPCCTLWNSFVQNVRLSNDDMLEDCTEAKCQKFAHVQFMAQELQLSMHTLPDYKDATFQYDFTVTPAELSNLFAHALIGRHFAASQNDDIKQHAFLSFNSMTQMQKSAKNNPQFKSVSKKAPLNQFASVFKEVWVSIWEMASIRDIECSL